MMTKLLAVVSAYVLAVAFAPIAHSDEDDDFVRALERAGFVFDGGGRTNSVELGHWVCDSLNAGASAGALSYSIQESSTRLSGTGGPGAFVNIAILMLCPQHGNQVS